MIDKARDRFLDIVSRIDPSVHIAGTEENVRTKIAVPLFQALGYDIIDDLYLDCRGVDLLIQCGGMNRLLVEVKTLIRYVRARQVLSYSYNLKCPWICVVGQDGLLVYHALGLLQGKKSLPLFASTAEELAQPGKFEELRSMIGKEAVLSGEGLLKSRAAETLNLGPEDLASWFEQLEPVAGEAVEVVPATQAMWEQLAGLVPDIEKRLDEFVAGRPGLARGYPNDPYVLKTSSLADTESLDEFGKTLEQETGGRGARFFKTVTRFGTLVMEPADD